MRGSCPCLRGEPLESCCGPYLLGDATPPTAEHLMRSRYSAFVLGNAGYVLTSWHRTTAPSDIELDPLQRWYRLDIHRAQAGGLLDSEGTVEFSAFYKHPDGNGVLREASRFVREDGRWKYLDGVIAG